MELKASISPEHGVSAGIGSAQAIEVDVSKGEITELKASVSRNQTMNGNIGEKKSLAAGMMMIPSESQGTSDHEQLYNRSAPNQHPISAITGLEEALEQRTGSSWDSITDKPFDTLGDTLKVNNRMLNVNSTDAVEQDNTLPITSAAVYTTVGNIQALLNTV